MGNEKDTQRTRIPEDQEPTDAIPVSKAKETSYTSSNISWTSEPRQKVIPEDQEPTDAIPVSKASTSKEMKS